MPVEHFFFNDGFSADSDANNVVNDAPANPGLDALEVAWAEPGHQGFLLEGELWGSVDNPLQRLLTHPAVHGGVADTGGEPTNGGNCADGDEHYLRVDFQGKEYAVGNPEAAAPPESVTLADDSSMNILSDTDGDGRVDYVSSVQFNGRWSAWRWVGEGGSGGGGVAQKNENHPLIPEYGGQEWEPGTWKCVERGEWG